MLDMVLPRVELSLNMTMLALYKLQCSVIIVQSIFSQILTKDTP